MSIFSYGAPAGSTDPSQGVVMTYIHTQGVDDEPIYSDDGMDYLYTKRTLTIRGIINANVPPATISDQTPAALYDRIRQTLETPRRQLFFFHNSTTEIPAIIQSPKPGNVVDSKNGPFPKRVALTQIQGSQCFLAELVYETYVVQCDPGSTDRPNYISHRWRETHQIDERFYTTITRQGKVVVRADIHANPDVLRHLIAPKLQPGFKRKKAEYVLQEDGLALMYTFVDEEVPVMPPKPAVRAEGEYIESTAEGQLRHGEVRVRLEGAKTTDRGDLLALAITIAVYKLQLAGPIIEGKWLLSGAVRESLYDNIVEVRFRCQIQQLQNRVLGAAIDLDRFSAPPVGSDDNKPPDYGYRGTAGLLAAAAALNDPCLATQLKTATNPNDESSMRTKQPGDNGDQDTGGPPAPTVLRRKILPDDQTWLRGRIPVGGNDGVFTDYKIRTGFGFDDQNLLLATCQQNALAAIVQVAAGTAIKTVEFEAMRVGAMPLVPNPYEDDPNKVLLRGDVKLEKVDTGADGVTPRYTVSGKYQYGYVDRSKVVINAGVPPYLDTGRVNSLRPLPPDAFAKGLTDDPLNGTPGLWDRLFQASLKAGSP